MNEEIKCSKDNPCQECQAKQKELLAKIEDWEIKWKAKIEKFEFIEAEFCPNKTPDNPSRSQYSSFIHGYNYHSVPCPSCQAVIKIIKSNSHGDQTEELKEHTHTASCHASNQIKSNQIKSNQIKSNQINLSARILILTKN
ncbi:MAG: hypothetical protein MRERV_38c018 [Mycoplasmataceae bacterium RV_VA103A]|nr:MAG: hypothetical protein MRERV_38c018 [Mycoplasmataceae bacterium RV_VA103A]